MDPYWVYILANKHHNVLYIGMTNDLRRPWKDAMIAKMNPEWKDLSEG